MTARKRRGLTRCHICANRCEREVEPACGGLPAVTAADVWRVIARNRIVLNTCLSCWMLWPDDWKHFPEVGFGSTSEDNPKRSRLTLEEFVELVGPA